MFLMPFGLSIEVMSMTCIVEKKHLPVLIVFVVLKSCTACVFAVQSVVVVQTRCPCSGTWLHLFRMFWILSWMVPITSHVTKIVTDNGLARLTCQCWCRLLASKGLYRTKAMPWR